MRVVSFILVFAFFQLSCAARPAPVTPVQKGLPILETSQVRRVEAAMDSYRKISERGGWPEISPGPRLQRGDQSERVFLLRERLRISGGLKKNSEGDISFDEELDQALSRFQESHGLEPSGILDKETVAALNVPVEERIRQLEINRDRLQGLTDLGERYVVVNIPDFGLKVFEKGRPVLAMKVIVGLKRDWQTPLLDSRITYLILNPKWHVPPDIFKKEVLGKIREDGEYLAKENMVVVRTDGQKTEVVDPTTIDWGQVNAEAPNLKIVQREGAGNSLGRIKFMFPNRYAVYLHDTPSKRLFNRRVRALSHGCVRVEKPLELAEFLMKGDPRWTLEGIQSAIRGGKNQSVSLPEPVPVHIIYLTAWVDGEGTVQFRGDIYGRDRYTQGEIPLSP